ncbi:acyltransferase family protein [Colwelliaceae bacterium 6441]
MKRYLALDALRGLTIALMILVNTPGSWSHVYAPFLHAQWHGCTPTDLVFPFFLFIIGSAMFFSLKKTQGQFSSQLLVKIIKRGLIIFFIGVALNAYPFVQPIEELRYMGVLQRIGIAYFLAAIMVVTLKRKVIIFSCIAILLCYWLLVLSVGVDRAFSLEGNVVRQFDLWLLGDRHMYRGLGLAFDPEGVLSSLPAVVSVLIGFEVTRYLTSISDHKKVINKLLFIGLTLSGIALLWHELLPINKSLWSSSYVLFSSGIACIVLAAFVYLLDIKHQRKFAEPLLVYGTNPLFIYVLSWLWVTTYLYVDINGVDLYQWLFNQLSSIFAAKMASFIFALIHVLLFWYISRVLYQRKLFIKI